MFTVVFIQGDSLLGNIFETIKIYYASCNSDKIFFLVKWKEKIIFRKKLGEGVNILVNWTLPKELISSESTMLTGRSFKTFTVRLNSCCIVPYFSVQCGAGSYIIYLDSRSKLKFWSGRMKFFFQIGLTLVKRESCSWHSFYI